MAYGHVIAIYFYSFTFLRLYATKEKCQDADTYFLYDTIETYIKGAQETNQTDS